MSNGRTIASIAVATVIASSALWEYMGSRAERKAIKAKTDITGAPQATDDTALANDTTNTDVVPTEQTTLTLPLYASLRPSTIATAMGSGIVSLSGYGTDKFASRMMLVGSTVVVLGLGATEYTGRTTLVEWLRN